MPFQQRQSTACKRSIITSMTNSESIVSMKRRPTRLWVRKLSAIWTLWILWRRVLPRSRGWNASNHKPLTTKPNKLLQQWQRHHRRRASFNRICQTASICTSMAPWAKASQRPRRHVDRFSRLLQGLHVRPTNRQTHRQTHTHTDHATSRHTWNS